MTSGTKNKCSVVKKMNFEDEENNNNNSLEKSDNNNNTNINTNNNNGNNEGTENNGFSVPVNFSTPVKKGKKKGRKSKKELELLAA